MIIDNYGVVRTVRKPSPNNRRAPANVATFRADTRKSSFDNVRARQNLVGVAHQKFEELVFARPEVEALLAAARFVLCGIEFEIGDAQARAVRVRDVTLGEDACQVHTGHTAHALAIFRNALLSLLQWKGWGNIAAANRHYAAFAC